MRTVVPAVVVRGLKLGLLIAGVAGLVGLGASSTAGCSGEESGTGKGPGKSGKPGGPARAGGSSGPSAGKGPPPARVELATAEAGDLTDGWTFLGQVQSALSAELAAAVAGHVLSVGPREGDRVTKNQVLLALDSAKVRAELDAVRAREAGLVTEVELAGRQLKRVSELSYPTVSDTERERFELDLAKVEAELAIQRAELRRLQVELARHSVKAPFGGIVTARQVDPGAWVSVGQPVLTLVSLDELEVHVPVSAELGRQIAVGGQVRLLQPRADAGSLASAPGESGGEARGERSGKSRGASSSARAIGAEIVGIVQTLDSATRTMLVRMVPAERPSWLLAGMAIDVEFSVSMAGRGVLVPRDAVMRGPVESRIVVYDAGQGRSVTVEVLATAGERMLVRGDGLEVGDQVVIRGNERWRPGQPLQAGSGGEGSAGKSAPTAKPTSQPTPDSEE